MTEAEAAAERMDVMTVCQITCSLRVDRGQNQDLTEKAKDGSTITEENAKLERWREHSQQLLSRCDPTTLRTLVRLNKTWIFNFGQ